MGEKEITLSVIIPVYNAENFLARCLDSVLGQTLGTIEIICIDDGSQDGSFDILQNYQNRFGNVIAVRQENAGPSAARNRGISLAHGKYIAFVDSDDCIDSEMYEAMVRIAEEHSLKVVMCNYINEYAHKPDKAARFDLPADRIISRNEIERIIFPHLMQDSMYNGPCNKVYLKAFIDAMEQQMPEDLRYGEDLIFQLELFDKLQETYFANRPFYHYIHRENSLSCAKKDMLETTLIPMYLIRKRYAEKWGLGDELAAEYFSYYAIMDLVNSAKGKTVSDQIELVRKFIANPTIACALKTGKLMQKNYTWKLKVLYCGCRLLSMGTNLTKR